MFDGKSFGAEIVAAVKEYVQRAIAPITSRLDGLDQRAVELKSAIDAIPDGKNGVDGVGFDDMAAEYDGERTITLRFQRGEVVKTFSFEMPVVLDRGVWREGEHKSGDGVTWAGSYWICQRNTSSKPGVGDDWRLAVKRGRDGGKA
ncbi:hypothetical protein FHT87_004598 [Rhizobium sp. BK316]|uniref:hypothetical protein n=1 Tax=Rhizobium sp. BK316 TaxID=2587053 RepID=UPI0017BE2FCD|nr:hypothetical protein [Rhizobium sp. BK316]MBB3410666.1 hypothetical protein [Rhizobium sp. BK316]